MNRSRRDVERTLSLAAICAAFAALAVVVLTLGRDAPDLVPEHYGTGGRIDSWGSKAGILTPVTIIGAAIFALLAPAWPYDRISKASNCRPGGASGRYKKRRAAYWLTDSGRAAHFRATVTAAMRQIGALVIGLLAFALTQTMLDGRVLSPGSSTSAMPAWTFPVVVTVFLAGTFAAAINLLLNLRTPPEWEPTVHHTRG